MQITSHQSLNTLNYHNHHQVFPKEEYEDVFSFSSQLPPLDFSCSGIVGYNNGWGWDYFPHELVGMQETLLPFSESDILLNDPFFYPPLDFSHTLVPEVFWEEIGRGFESESQALVNISGCKGVMSDEKLKEEEKKKGVKRLRDEEERNSKKLTRKIISQYFYMPITQAARQLNVGLTLLKKRCRELGIRRWPHRKLMSLQTLINNVQEFGKEESESKLKESLQILEQQKKLMEEIPDMQLEEKTKRLRQSFFKANYKKRKLMGMVDSSSSSSSSFPKTANPECPLIPDENVPGFVEEEDEEFKLLLSDCFSCPIF